MAEKIPCEQALLPVGKVHCCCRVKHCQAVGIDLEQYPLQIFGCLAAMVYVQIDSVQCDHVPWHQVCWAVG